VFLNENRVTWFGDGNVTEGELKMIWEKTDGSYIEYPNDHHDAIKKIRKKRAECNHE